MAKGNLIGNARVWDENRIDARANVKLPSYMQADKDYLDGLNFEDELAGGNEDFYIKVIAIVSDGGNMLPMYGVFNRTTGVRESETRQYAAAKTWVDVLSKVARGEDPELSDDLPSTEVVSNLH